MLSEKRFFHLRKSAATLCIALSVALFSPPILYPAAERFYAREIEQYVAEDKVYLLENIQQNITRPSEKTVVDALLCESGPEAIELFQKQLNDYPDPLLDSLSTARIAAYNQALGGTLPLPKLSQPLPSTKSTLAEVQDSTKQQVAHIAEKPEPETRTPPPLFQEKATQERADSLTTLPNKSTLPLSHSLAENLKKTSTIVKKEGFTLQFGSFASKENAEILTRKIFLYEPTITVQQGDLYKVILKNNYASKEEAEALMKKLPFIAIIVSAEGDPR